MAGIDFEELFRRALEGRGGFAPIPQARPDEAAPVPMAQAVQAAKDEQPRPGGLLGHLFGGGDGTDSHGSMVSRMFQDDPEKQEALANGLLNAGAAMMVAGGPSVGKPTNFLSVLGSGVGAGSQAYQNYRKDASDIALNGSKVAGTKAALQLTARKQANAARLKEILGTVGWEGLSQEQLAEVAQIAADNQDEATFRDAVGMMQKAQQKAASEGLIMRDGKAVPLPGLLGSTSAIEEAKSSGRKAGEAPYETTTDITNYKFAQNNPGFVSDNMAKRANDADQKARDGFKNEQDLRKEYTSTPVYKRYDDVRASFDRIQTGAERDTGAGDIGVIFGYMKMLDPGSVVREGEFATAENSSGIPDYVRNIYNKAVSGERLTAGQRKEFVSASQDLYKKEAGKMDELNTRYTDIAKAHGFDSGRIVIAPKQYDLRDPMKEDTEKKPEPKSINGGIPKITSPEERSRLPSNIEFYIAPDGTKRRNKNYIAPNQF